jgi:outer membrane protein TolC
MPTFLVGRKEDRVARATALSARQDELYAVIVGLVRLEAVNAFNEYAAATDRLKLAKQSYELGRETLEQARKAAAANQNLQLVAESEAVAGQTLADYLDAVLKHIRALAKLERVTAGGVRAGFPGR